MTEAIAFTDKGRLLWPERKDARNWEIHATEPITKVIFLLFNDHGDEISRINNTFDLQNGDTLTLTYLVDIP